MKTNLKLNPGLKEYIKFMKPAVAGAKDTVVVTDFCDGEFQPSFEENIRGNDIFIVQSTFAPASNLLELLMLISMPPAGPPHETSSP